jgi:hypothetical protein
MGFFQHLRIDKSEMELKVVDVNRRVLPECLV